MTLPLLLAVASAAAQTPDLPRALRPLDQEIARYESAELREPGAPRWIPPSNDDLTQARARVEAYLRHAPDDAAALLLQARIGRFILIQSLGAICAPDAPCALNSGYDPTPFVAALDHALALHPEWAAAHYWNARFLADGRPVIRDGEFALDVDTAAVLAHAERAVALDPAGVRPRELLATTLADLGRYAAAAAALEPLEGGRHPLRVLLEEFDALPLPPGTVPWPGRAPNAAGMDESPPRFTEYRSRALVTRLTPEEVAAFYRGRWPDVRFFRLAVAIRDSTVWLQFFSPDSAGVWQPARDSTFVDDPAWWERERAGLLVTLRHAGAGLDAAGTRFPAGFGAGGRFTEITIMSGRGER
jgi:hypothetical protein